MMQMNLQIGLQLLKLATRDLTMLYDQVKDLEFWLD
jgi:hypothetical protein